MNIPARLKFVDETYRVLAFHCQQLLEYYWVVGFPIKYVSKKRRKGEKRRGGTWTGDIGAIGPEVSLLLVVLLLLLLLLLVLVLLLLVLLFTV
jgi:hypothetical protein